MSPVKLAEQSPAPTSDSIAPENPVNHDDGFVLQQPPEQTPQQKFFQNFTERLEELAGQPRLTGAELRAKIKRLYSGVKPANSSIPEIQPPERRARQQRKIVEVDVAKGRHQFMQTLNKQPVIKQK